METVEILGEGIFLHLHLLLPPLHLLGEFSLFLQIPKRVPQELMHGRVELGVVLYLLMGETRGGSVDRMTEEGLWVGVRGALDLRDHGMGELVNGVIQVVLAIQVGEMEMAQAVTAAPVVVVLETRQFLPLQLQL